MTQDLHAPPPERSLPPGHVSARRGHLLRELGRTGGHPRPTRVLRPRHALLAAAVAIVAVAVAPAFGMGHWLFGRLDSDPRLPGIVGNRVQQLLSVPTPAGEASLWIGPTQASGRCVFIHIGGAATSGSGAAPTPNGGSQCDIGPSSPQTLPIATDLTWYPADGTFTLLLDGHVAAGSRIAKLTLESGTETRTLALAKGYFLTDLAVAPQGQLPASGRPYILVGYDGQNHEVSRVDLARLTGSASP
jgi:hypothetical protein